MKSADSPVGGLTAIILRLWSFGGPSGPPFYVGEPLVPPRTPSLTAAAWLRRFRSRRSARLVEVFGVVSLPAGEARLRRRIVSTSPAAHLLRVDESPFHPSGDRDDLAGDVARKLVGCQHDDLTGYILG